MRSKREQWKEDIQKERASTNKKRIEKKYFILMYTKDLNKLLRPKE